LLLLLLLIIIINHCASSKGVKFTCMYIKPLYAMIVL